MFTQLDILVLFHAALQLSRGEEEKSKDIVIYFDMEGITVFTHRVDASVSEMLCHFMHSHLSGRASQQGDASVQNPALVHRNHWPRRVAVH